MKPTSCNDDGDFDHVSHALQRPPSRHGPPARMVGPAAGFEAVGRTERRGERDKTAGKRTAAPTNVPPFLLPFQQQRGWLLGWLRVWHRHRASRTTNLHQCLRPSIKSWHHHYLTGFLRRRRRRSVCASIARIQFPMSEGATDVDCLVLSLVVH